jgi:GDP-L-fucose synthase
MELRAKIYVAGHRGLVGSALLRKLEAKGYENLVVRMSAELDLRRQEQVERFFEQENPEFVFLAAAKVGGILANSTYPGQFIYENLAIQSNILECARIYGVKKLLFLGSSCIYPRDCPQPIREEYLLTGPLEKTNEAYALAKIAGIKTCQAYRAQYGCNFISVMPTNLYGPNDNYDLQNSHVLPALIRKCHEAKVKGEPFVTLWGTGSPRREFLHVDDLADASLFLMNHYNEGDIINIGTGEDLAIRDLAEVVKRIIGFEGEIRWDSTKPDGTPRKMLWVERLHQVGWRHRIGLEEGIATTYRDYMEKTRAGSLGKG